MLAITVCIIVLLSTPHTASAAPRTAPTPHGTASAPPPTPTIAFPLSFAANVTETTWAPYATHTVFAAYDWASTSLVIARPDGSTNPICAAANPHSSEPCTQLALDENSRFLLFPRSRRCCTLCSSACGTEKPGWVHAVPSLYAGWVQVAGRRCDSWVLASNTPDRLSLDAAGRLCQLYDGGADFVGDGAWLWDVDPAHYAVVPDSAVFALPAWCSNVSVPCHNLPQA